MNNIYTRKQILAGTFAFAALLAVIANFGNNPSFGPVSKMNGYMSAVIAATITPGLSSETLTTTDVVSVAAEVPKTPTIKEQCNDGIDNDGDGSTDKDDYSCVNGKTEDSFGKGLNYQSAVIMWPGGPRFQNRQQCRNYCFEVDNACTKPLYQERTQRRALCAQGSSCNVGPIGECEHTVPRIHSLCSITVCLACVDIAERDVQTRLDQCQAQATSCRASCDRMFPGEVPVANPGTAPAAAN